MTLVVQGTPVALGAPKPRPGGAFEYRAAIGQPSAAPVKIALRIEQRRGAWYRKTISLTAEQARRPRTWFRRSICTRAW